MEIIDMDELKFRQRALDRKAEFEGLCTIEVPAGISGESIQQLTWNFTDFTRYLTPEERVKLNGVFARAHRRYNAARTDYSGELPDVSVLSVEEATALAIAETEKLNELRREQIEEAAKRRRGVQEARLVRIEKQYKDRIAKINTDAGRRGMLSSTVVLDQVDRAWLARIQAEDAVQSEIDFINSRLAMDLEKLAHTSAQRVGVLAKRLRNESVRESLAVVREKNASASRSFKDFLNLQSARLTMPINAQSFIQQEIYDEYVSFLMTQTHQRAYRLIDYDPLFHFNLTLQQWISLFTEFSRRVGHVG